MKYNFYQIICLLFLFFVTGCASNSAYLTDLNSEKNAVYAQQVREALKHPDEDLVYSHLKSIIPPADMALNYHLFLAKYTFFNMPNHFVEDASLYITKLENYRAIYQMSMDGLVIAALIGEEDYTTTDILEAVQKLCSQPVWKYQQQYSKVSQNSDLAFIEYHTSLSCKEWIQGAQKSSQKHLVKALLTVAKNGRVAPPWLAAIRGSEKNQPALLFSSRMQQETQINFNWSKP